MSKRRFVELSELKKGMCIDQSIVDSTGRILITRGSGLEEFHIAEMRNLRINGVYIAESDDLLMQEEDIQISPNAQQMVRKLSVEDRPALILRENVKKQVAEGIQFLFNNPDSEGFLEATNAVADDLMTAMVENDAVAVDVNALKVCDEYTFKHSVDVGSIAMVIGKTMNLPRENIREIGVAGLLHDLGKSKIPNEILNKPGRLTDEEFAVMKKHSLYGYEMIMDKPGLSQNIKLGVLQHHEKMGGNGYPMGVAGSKIGLIGRILSVADVYDALVTERPYKSAFSPRDAVEMIMAMSKDLDNNVIRAFLRSVILYPVGTVLRLSNGEAVRVVENVEGHPTRPKVVELTTGRFYDLANDMTCASLLVP